MRQTLNPSLHFSKLYPLVLIFELSTYLVLNLKKKIYFSDRVLLRHVKIHVIITITVFEYKIELVLIIDRIISVVFPSQIKWSLC
jgi:hypothetical protein